MSKKYLALGLMSGTSMDGIDIALLETDGHSDVRPIAGASFPYDPLFRDHLRGILGNKAGRSDPKVAWVEEELTKRHAVVVRTFLADHALAPERIDLIGFHGHTIWHQPRDMVTIQIGCGADLAQMTGIDVVSDFRSADVAAGGQGAPLVPLYHRALAAALPKPVVLLNIGGVANLTWIAGDGDDEILAFDTGPGNALLDDWMGQKTGHPCDTDGAMAMKGSVNACHMDLFRHHPYFTKGAPKSLDRDAFTNFVPRDLDLADGAATLTMMTVEAILNGLALLPQEPQNLYVVGGGRHNATMMRWLAQRLPYPVANGDVLGWNGDFLEAEAFAYLAVRSVLGLPLSLPKTTGVDQPMRGGVLTPKRS